MTTPKKPRGRPKGSGINDLPTLEKMAGLIVANPDLKVTTAIKQVLNRPAESVIRRLQSKWQASGSELLARAIEAKTPRPRRPVSNVPVSNFALRVRAQQDAVGEYVRQAVGGLDFGIIRASREMNGSLASRAAREASESLVMRASREAFGGTIAQAMREAYESIASRAFREAYESTSLKAMRDAHYGTASRAIEEAYESLGCGVSRRGY